MSDDCDRALAFNIVISSGQIAIASPIEDIALIDVPVGDYVIYVLAYNLGVDQLSVNEADKDLDDAEFEQRTDFERYGIVSCYTFNLHIEVTMTCILLPQLKVLPQLPQLANIMQFKYTSAY